jgi:hypothetical protein
MDPSSRLCARSAKTTMNPLSYLFLAIANLFRKKPAEDLVKKKVLKNINSDLPQKKAKVIRLVRKK